MVPADRPPTTLIRHSRDYRGPQIKPDDHLKARRNAAAALIVEMPWCHGADVRDTGSTPATGTRSA